jgi:hypothetical protein
MVRRGPGTSFSGVSVPALKSGNGIPPKGHETPTQALISVFVPWEPCSGGPWRRLMNFELTIR